MYRRIASLATCLAFVLTMGGSLVVPQAAQAARPAHRPFIGTTLTATKSVALTDTNSNGKADPGETLTYTIAVTNSTGSSASNVVVTDPLDSHTTYVNGSLHASPIATNDSYTTVGNTELAVGVSAGGYPAVTSSTKLFANDSIATDSFQLKSFQNPSASGGTVSVNSDGSFTYLPPVGYTGTDTFTYTLENSADTSLQDTATVSITVSSRVWYVDNSYAGANGASDGRSTRPFTSLTPVSGADAAGDTIYVSSGNANYTTGLTLKNNEALVGSGAALVVNSTTIAAAGTAPTLATNPITLASGNTLTGFNLNNTGSAAAISGTSVGTLTVSGVQISTTGSALNLTGVSTPGVNVSFTSITSSGGTNNVKLTGLGGTVSLGSGALSGASGDSFLVSGGTASISYAGTITSGSAHSVNVGSMSGGGVTFSGDVTDTGTGITLTSNTGATISFTGGISASTGTNRAFYATGGGTVVATQNNSTIVNTLTTTTATALTVSSTTIGASGLTFRSISSNGANPGISLSSTGSSGGLTVTGNGGTCSSAATCTGGTIQSSSGEGINLSSTTSPSFTGMLIENNAVDGINGSSVSGFILSNSTVSGNGTAANVSNTSTQIDDGLDFRGGLIGTVTISNSTITNSADSGLEITDSSGSLNLTVTGSTFSGSGPGLASYYNACLPNCTKNLQLGDGIEILPQGTTNATVSVTSSTFSNNYGYDFDFQASVVQGNGPATGTGSGTNSVTFKNNTLSNTVGTGDGGSVEIEGEGSSTTTVDVESNSIQGAFGNAIGLYNDGTTQLSGTVGAPNTFCSGSIQPGNDIRVIEEGTGTTTLAITNNNLYQYNAEGIYTDNQLTSATMNLTITGNTIADPVPYNPNGPQCPGSGGGADVGLYLVTGGTTGDTSVTCADIRSNSMTGSSPPALENTQGTAQDFEFDQHGSAQFKLPGYTGASDPSGVGTPSWSNDVISYVQGRNISNGTPTGETFLNPDNGFTNLFVGTGAATTCLQPPAVTSHLKSVAVSRSAPRQSHSGARSMSPHRTETLVGRRETHQLTGHLRPNLTGVANGTAEVDLGALPNAKTVTIVFAVTINDPPDFSGPTSNQVTNSASVSATGLTTAYTNTVSTTVQLFNSTVSVGTSGSPSLLGQQVTFTATVSPVGTGVSPSGTVDFKDTFNSSTTTICSGQTLSLVGGQLEATCQVSNLAHGSHSITAHYNGDGNFNAGDATTPVSQVVNSPHLELAKTNNVTGSVTYPTGWTWTLTASNVGDGAATFTTGQTILQDDLPSSGLTYGSVSVPAGSQSGISGTGSISCAINGSQTLTCTASGGTVTIGASNGAFAVLIPVTPSLGGVYANPRASGKCQIDPAGVIAESDTTGNTCSDSVTVNGAGPTISASPVTAPSTSTTVTWTTGDGSVGQVWMKIDGGTESLFAQGAGGTASAPWIMGGHTYTFTLYAGTSHTTVLGTPAIVTPTIPAHFISASPNPVTTGHSTVITWSTGSTAAGQVWVSMNGRPEVLVATGPYGTLFIPWILPGHAYVFSLYAGTSHTPPATDTVTVRSGTPTIVAGTNPVTGGGTTTLDWSTGDGSAGTVCVAVNGGTQTAVPGPGGAGSDGMVTSGAIATTDVDVFTLHTGAGCSGTALASVRVTGTAAPFIAANPTPVVNSSSSTVSWNTGSASIGQVWVSVDGATEVLVIQGVSGSVSIPWLQPGHSYVFTLYAGTSHTPGSGTPLASVTVNPFNFPSISATPNPVTSGNSTTVSWDTGDGGTGEVWVSVNGGAETLVARSPKGSATPTWIQPGVIYTFTLYQGTGHSVALAQVNVTHS